MIVYPLQVSQFVDKLIGIWLLGPLGPLIRPKSQKIWVWRNFWGAINVNGSAKFRWAFSLAGWPEADKVFGTCWIWPFSVLEFWDFLVLQTRWSQMITLGGASGHNFEIQKNIILCDKLDFWRIGDGGFLAITPRKIMVSCLLKKHKKP